MVDKAKYVIPYVSDEGTALSDSLHLAYNEDGLHWIALNDSNGILFPKLDTKRMCNPFLFRKKDGKFVLLANGGSNRTGVFIWETDDLIRYNNERFVTVNNTNIGIWAPKCMYDSDTGTYKIYGSDDVNHYYTTMDFITIASEVEHPCTDKKIKGVGKEYANATLDGGQRAGSDASQFGLIFKENYGNAVQVTQMELDVLKERFTSPKSITSVENVPIMNIKVNTQHVLPLSLKVKYDNGLTDRLSVVWDPVNIQDAVVQGKSIIVTGTVYSASCINPLIMNRADPYIYKHFDGYYYFTASYNDNTHNNDERYQYNHVILRKANTIQGLATAKEVIIYTKPLGSGGTSPHVWAPEIHYIHGKWYIYYTETASNSNKWEIRPHVLECSGDPMIKENWVIKGPIQKTNFPDMAFNGFSLDETIFEHNGEMYLVWAQNNPYSNLYIAKMSNPWQVSTDAVMIATPEYTWETQGFRVNEGPSIIKRNHKIFLTYSASATDANYCMGLLTASEDGDLLDPLSWSKTPYPVFVGSRANGQFGPGHNSFTVSEDGVQDMFVYHARQVEKYISNSYEPLYDSGRHARVQRLYWNSDGTPNFGWPLADGASPSITAEVTAFINICD